MLFNPLLHKGWAKRFLKGEKFGTYFIAKGEKCLKK